MKMTTADIEKALSRLPPTSNIDQLFDGIMKQVGSYDYAFQLVDYYKKKKKEDPAWNPWAKKDLDEADDVIRGTSPDESDLRPCYPCRGDGEINGRTCHLCHGMGYSPSSTWDGESDPMEGAHECEECGSMVTRDADTCPECNTPVPETPDEEEEVHVVPHVQHESFGFDKFMDQTLLKETRSKTVDSKTVSPQRRLARNYQEHPLGKTKAGIIRG